jgi:hypothetical protein
LQEMSEPIFIPMALFFILSISFMGLFDTVINTNWRFYSIISMNFKYHIKRLLIFISFSYCIVIFQYIFLLIHISKFLLFIYLYAMLLTLLLSISFAFLKINMIKKIFIYILYIRIAMYILYTIPLLMLVGILPLIILFYIVKNDFIKWGYL